MRVPGIGELDPIYRGRRFVVLRGRRLDDGLAVVVKVAVPGPSAAAQAQALLAEHVLLSSLQIDGTARPLALEDNGPGRALVLEDAGPRTLKDWLRQNVADAERFLTLAIPITATVAALHARGIVHRDVTPANLVLDASGNRLTLVDFDSALVLDQQPPPPAASEAIVGTLAYVAPEQTGRTGRPVDHRADLYSLGITFYEMLTGSVPFTSDDPVALVHAHLARPPAPPQSFNPRVPEMLSRLVLRLIAKTPEERYPSARALLGDLERALEAQRASGAIALFQLSSGDAPAALGASHRVLGREAESAQVLSALERASHGTTEVLLLRGPAGVGKSALAEELGRRMREDALPGRFAAGKFDQLRGDAPYAAIVEALRALCRSWLDQGLEARSLLETQLRAALGRNARLLTDLLPELEALLGGSPPVAQLGPREAESRFQLTFTAFVRAAAERERPLVLFIDDLQWADAASFRLLELLATDPDMRHLLLLTATRDDEPASGPSFEGLVKTVADAGVTAQILRIGPLDPQAVVGLVAEILQEEQAAVAPLAEVVLRKTAGNAFFVGRFLHHLRQESLLRWDETMGGWIWDLSAIEQAEVTENVLGLMASGIRRLPEPAVRVLEAAACFRRRVDPHLLALVTGQGEAETQVLLEAALAEGLLLPEAVGPSAFGTEEEPESQSPRAYRFVHDRIQQAAYSLMAEPERAQAHLAIGQRLLEGASPEELEARLYDIVDQLARALPQGLDPPLRHRLAELAQQAGQRARTASATATALEHFLLGIACLEPGPEKLRSLAFSLHREAMQMAFVTGNHPLAEQLSSKAFSLAHTPLERADLHNIRLMACSVRSAYREAIEEGRGALAELGLSLDDDGLDTQDLQERLRARLSSTGPGLIDLPVMTDPLQLGRMGLLANLLDPAYVCDQALLARLVDHMVDLSLRHGNSVHSGFAYTVRAMILANRDGDTTTGHHLGRVGVDLARRFGDPIQECRSLHIFGTFVNHWAEDITSSLPRLRAAVARGLEGGDLHYAAYAEYNVVAVEFHRGTELSQVAQDVEAAFALSRKTRVQASQHDLRAFQQAVRCLQDRTRSRASFEDEGFSEAAHLLACAGNPVALWFYWVLRLQTAVMLGTHREGVVPRGGSPADTEGLYERARAYLGPGSALCSAVDLVFCGALVHAARLGRKSPSPDEGGTPGAIADGPATLLARLEEGFAQLERWARSCPANFRHKQLIIEAELCRVTGRASDAATLYDRALDAIPDDRFLQDRALGSELAGRFHRQLGRRRISDFYLRAALEGFARWGAMGKVAALEEEFPHLAELPWQAPLPNVGTDGKALDMLGLLKAAESISGEVVLDRLLEKLLSVCFAVAGATRGALVLDGEGSLAVYARGATHEPPNLERVPLLEARDLPRLLVERALRSSEPIVLGDTTRQALFAGAAESLPALRSAVALPILHHARPVGVLYLENSLVPHAFSAARLKVLTLLSTQMAISLENSLLFTTLNLEVEERKRAEARAQEAVRLREEFLSIAAHELNTPLAALKLSLQMLGREKDPPSERAQDLRKLAEKQGQRLGTLVQDLLDVSRIHEGRLRLCPTPVDLPVLVREILAMLEPEREEARCEVTLRTPEAVVGTWDRLRLEQVVGNLLSNAFKFGRGRPVEIEIQGAGGQATLVVRDRGIGIPPEKLSHIFERFERAVSADNYGGLGLGLYIAREIVVAQGGRIEAANQVGGGASFTVALPLDGQAGQAGRAIPAKIRGNAL